MIPGGFIHQRKGTYACHIEATGSWRPSPPSEGGTSSSRKQAHAEVCPWRTAVGPRGLRHGFPASASASGLRSGGWVGRCPLLRGSGGQAARRRGCRRARNRASDLDRSLAPGARSLGFQLGQVQAWEGGAGAWFLTLLCRADVGALEMVYTSGSRVSMNWDGWFFKSPSTRTTRPPKGLSAWTIRPCEVRINSSGNPCSETVHPKVSVSKDLSSQRLKF